ncbi:hypothetical protein, partial [Paenibacillus dendritiformis]|uniref:hypothetical protein n=1 Tax=Paenibacillus dendritiformis TaxID=130049 RepID=UPI000DAF597A
LYGLSFSQPRVNEIAAFLQYWWSRVAGDTQVLVERMTGEEGDSAALVEWMTGAADILAGNNGR